MTEIRFEGIVKRFGEAVVVKELNLTINDREFFTFVGPSGCGKTTILNMLAGLEPVSKGIIYFDGQPVNMLSPAKRDVAMVFQNYALYPHMSVYDNIAFPLRVRRRKGVNVDKEVTRVAALLGLEPHIKKMPGELSGGQRQRVALGRAIIRKPSLFLMDEPLSNLDARLRIEMRTELRELHRRLNITTVYVTHDQEEAMVLSDRIAVLLQGSIQQVGLPSDLYARPENIFVAGFIGSPPMKFIDGGRLSGDRFFSSLTERFGEGDFIIGVRPSDIIAGNKGEGIAFKGELLMMESTGSDLWVDILWRGIKIKGRAENTNQISPGSSISFTIPPDKIHIFNKSTGKRI